MPEGPEVRRYAVQLAHVLDGQRIVGISARNKAAKAWLAAEPDALVGRKIRHVRAHGKNLFAQIEGGFYFCSHLMMWGRWTIEASEDRVLEADKRERARITTQNHHAILLSAPVFEIGAGDARHTEYLAQLGPDILPYEDDADWNEHEFLKRLFSPQRSENGAREIGAALLDQTICAGIGNYLRAEILFACQINPFARIADLSAEKLACLNAEIPRVARFAYENGGATTDDDSRERLRSDDTLVYSRASDWGTRHLTFRRTNLPCLRCGDTIRQKRQVTRIMEDGDKTRIIYFCPTCQKVPFEAKPKKSSTRSASK